MPTRKWNGTLYKSSEYGPTPERSGVYYAEMPGDRGVVRIEFTPEFAETFGTPDELLVELKNKGL